MATRPTRGAALTKRAGSADGDPGFAARGAGPQPSAIAAHAARIKRSIRNEKRGTVMRRGRFGAASGMACYQPRTVISPPSLFPPLPVGLKGRAVELSTLERA